MHHVIRTLVIAVAATTTMAGCDILNPEDATDTDTRPGGKEDNPFDIYAGDCAINWRVVDEADLGTRARIENQRLVMKSEGTDVQVEGLLGVPSGGRGAVLRFDFYMLDLAGDGDFRIEMVSPEGTIARLVVQPEGAVLMVESIPYGSNADLQFTTPPERFTFELELKADNGLEARAFFFEAGKGKVLSTSVPRFEGGMVTSLLTAKGHTEAKLERFARIDPGNGGLMEDFWCDSLGTATDRFRFPEGRASNAGKACVEDHECGAGELCRESVCRRACLASSQCLDKICIVGEEGGLCTVRSETCEATEPGTICGNDGQLRQACQRQSDCPRAEDLCLGDACYSNDEEINKDDKLWGTCKFGNERCQNDRIESCDTVAPGWVKVEQCQEDQCKSTGLDAFCDACVRSCGGLHAEDVMSSCDAGEPQVELDCRDAYEVCSTGDDNREEPHCRDIVAGVPPTASVQVGASSTWRIDPTEVTRAQYAAFLQKSPSIVSQSEDCAWNATYRAPDWPWFDAPDRAVQVDFCDAQAYCRSVGKQLCSAPQWYDTCSSGGANNFPYGDVFEQGRCAIDPRRDVGTNPECAAESGPFSGVMDMIGGVGEWVDACERGPTTVRAADSCKTRGTSASQSCEVERLVRRDSVAGFRCCSP